VEKRSVKKLKVFANLAITLDGKIADAKHPRKTLGSPADKRLMQKVRSLADVVVMGADTLRAINKSIVAKNKKKRHLANAIVSLSGKIDPASPFWDEPNVVRFLFTNEENYADAVKSAQDRAFVVAIGKVDLDPHLLLSALQNAGFQNILVEGGGRLIGLFLKENLIDEFYLTLTPWMLGGRDNPTLVSTLDTLSPWRKFRLISHKKQGNEIFLHYKKL
jgi:2,5-diamino-6-(ribosylamino)-4(3H)-pyrimidinone 5'-phosphate reductase